MARHPFSATDAGVPGHDHEVPDLSAAAEHAWGVEVAALQAEADALAPDGPADRITLEAVRHALAGEAAAVRGRAPEHTVALLGGEGPGRLLGLAGKTRLSTPEQAADHLERTARFAGYLDAHVERLREGAARGRSPVAALVAVALAQCDGYLDGEGDALADVAPPAGWDVADDWRSRLGALVTGEVRPAVARWRDAVAALPVRDDDRCGLVHLPDGAADYARLVAVNTTLPLTAQQVHDRGREAVAELVGRMTALGAGIGLSGWPAVRDAARTSGAQVEPETAMAQAREAVRRAEAAVVGVFPEPLPPPCEVTAMSRHLGSSGMPPHYTEPVPDRDALGTYWFNVDQPGAGSGWDLEATAYHEAVPGHHLQLSRQMDLPGVPVLQRKSFVTAHGEGWGLYAEVLAGELGLYSSVQAQLGALGSELFRAARLVVDTGVHALGWSRDRALAELTEVTAMPPAFVVSEVNRYIGLPGQALAYLTGQRELLRMRASARERLGNRFDLPGFHSAVLDSGALPLPAVDLAVDAWVAGLSQGA